MQVIRDNKGAAALVSLILYHRRKAGNLFENGKTLAALARTEMTRLAYRVHPPGGTPGNS